MILEDSFLNKDSSDEIFNQFLEKEKTFLTGVFINNRNTIEDMIINNKESNAQLIYNQKSKNNNVIPDGLVDSIIESEEIPDFFINKISEIIDSIGSDEKKYKIEHLNILLVGRKGVGKTTLIKYILDLDNNNINNNPSDFQEYTSQTIKYLKLIEVKGVGYDEGPDIICQKIKNYINNLSNSNGQNFNKVIHCIWYCLTDKRVLEEEEKLFKELTEIYKDNTMPIIFVYTKMRDPAIPQGIERELHSKNINNNFIRTMARNMKLVSGRILEAYGKKDLINTTLKNCTKAMESDMLKIMMQEISKSIKNQLIHENRENIKKILDKTKDDFIQNYNGVLNDRDFFEYIINIFTNNLKYFFNTLKKIKNKSRNLIFKSNFIANIYNVYSFYKRIISEKIKLIEIETAKELIDFQATFEKSKGNMKLNNRRNLKEFEESTKIFLKKIFILFLKIILFII